MFVNALKGASLDASGLHPDLTHLQIDYQFWISRMRRALVKKLPSLAEELIHHCVILHRRRPLDLVEKDLVLDVRIQVSVRQEMAGFYGIARPPVNGRCANVITCCQQVQTCTD